MTLQFVDEYINKKIHENRNFIKYTFYELRVKNNLSKEETVKFLELNKTYLENKDYSIYFPGDKYTYQNVNRTVKENELMIAIKRS